ncbi:MAG: hypothetical protein DMF71_10665, partial [Acidobacteria bacterium]
QNERYAVSTESGSDRVTILAISFLAIGGDPVATALGTDLILKLRHYRLPAEFALPNRSEYAWRKHRRERIEFRNPRENV